MSNTVIDEHCSTIRKSGADITLEELKSCFDLFASGLKETTDADLKCTAIEHISAALINLPYKTNKFAEHDLVTHELLTILRDDVIVDQLCRRHAGHKVNKRCLQRISTFFMNLSHKIEDGNIAALNRLFFHQPLIAELASCLHEIGTDGQHLHNYNLLRSTKSLLLTFKTYLRHQLLGNEYPMLTPIFDAIIECLCSKYAVNMIRSLKLDFVQSLNDCQILFLDTLPFYLQWYVGDPDPANYICILRTLLSEFTRWITSCSPESYIRCSGQIGRMIRHLNYFLVRPIESEQVHVFSEEFYHDYCKLVSHWVLTLSTILPCFSDQLNVKDSTRIIIKNLYNFTLHLNVLNYMKTMPNLIPMLLQVTDIEDDEMQVNAYRCLGKIMTEADIKTMSNPSQIATVYIDFISNTIDDPYQKERFHSLMNSLKNFVQHDQVKTELIALQALPLLVRCVVETQFDPIKVQQTSLEILLALSFNTDACAYLRQSHSFINHIRTLVLTVNPYTSGLQRAAEGLLWKLEEEEKGSGETVRSTSVQIRHHDQLFAQGSAAVPSDSRATSQRWISRMVDRDCLRGSTMVGIASAIENSKHVLICMSNTYKQSVYCHSEAHYAFERGCRLIPIVIEPNYKPDGWLGIIVSGKIYVEFGNLDFSLAYERLKNEINEDDFQDMNQSPAKTEDKDSTDTIFTYPQPGEIPYPSTADIPACITQWTHNDVKVFFLRNGLGHTLLPLFTHTDGPRLLQLYEMCLSNRESMYQSLKFELNEKHHTLLPIADYLNFLHEIKSYMPAGPAHTKPIQYSFLSLTLCTVM